MCWWNHVPDEKLKLQDVPSLDPARPWENLQEVWKFALMYDGYGPRGFAHVSAIANNANEEYFRSGQLPDLLTDLRLCLFFEQRRYRHLGFSPEGSILLYLSLLLEAIRELLGGHPSSTHESEAVSRAEDEAPEVSVEGLTEDDLIEYTGDGEPIINIHGGAVNFEGHRTVPDIDPPDSTVVTDRESMERWLVKGGISLAEFVVTDSGWRMLENTPWLEEMFFGRKVE